MGHLDWMLATAQPDRMVPMSSYRDRIALAAALSLPLAAAAILVPFRSSFPNTDAALVLVAVVVGVAANGHRVAGVLAAVSAAVWFDYFLTRPYEHFTITHRVDIETTLLLLVVGAAVTELAVRGRRQHLAAVTDGGYLAAIRVTTDLVAADEQPSIVIDRVIAQLGELLSLRDCHFERWQFGGMARLEQDGRMRRGETYWDVDQTGMPNCVVELLAHCKGRAYGRFVLDPTPSVAVPPAARQVAVILANQVGALLANQTRVGN